jgi:hypothetical protein
VGHLLKLVHSRMLTLFSMFRSHCIDGVSPMMAAHNAVTVDNAASSASNFGMQPRLVFVLLIF